MACRARGTGFSAMLEVPGGGGIGGEGGDREVGRSYA